jgi:hypothetical protein
VTPDDYLRIVAFELRDLPWGMRRDLISGLRAHLGELPADTNLYQRLGRPHEYAAELRAAAGLERRHGAIAFLRARRPRNLVLTALVLTVVGLAVGAVVWIDSYQPLATGNSAYGPLDAISSPTGDGVYVVFHEGKSFRYGTTIWNTGRYTVRVLGVPDFIGRHPIGKPIAVRLLMSAPTTFDYGGIPLPYKRFHPFDLSPGEQRGLLFVGTYDSPCRERGPGLSIGWDSIPVRYSFLWRTTTVQVPLPEPVTFVFRKSSDCH